MTKDGMIALPLSLAEVGLAIITPDIALLSWDSTIPQLPLVRSLSSP